MARIFVGLSGGVDSATSAALLKEEGHDIVGVFIKIWSPEFLECTWKEDRLDAMRVAVALNIPFIEIDLSEEYRKTVVEDMVAGYERGVTPNPDVLCNRAIKFGAFTSWVFAHGADMVATGHYARIEKRNEKFALLKGIDTSKDQSYFLYQLTSQELSRIAFPIGHLTKSQVRAEAKRFGLPVANKPDSQGLCFVGDVSMETFLSRFIPLHPGPVVDEHGNIIGEHHGAALFTKGQRHGFTLLQSVSDSSPYYVFATDVRENSIAVSREKEHAASGHVLLHDVHWIREAPQLPVALKVTVRYRALQIRATLVNAHRQPMIRFENPQIVSAGQSVVFYRDSECLGGGVIA